MLLTWVAGYLVLWVTMYYVRNKQHSNTENYLVVNHEWFTNFEFFLERRTGEHDYLVAHEDIREKMWFLNNLSDFESVEIRYKGKRVDSLPRKVVLEKKYVVVIRLVVVGSLLGATLASVKVLAFLFGR